MRIKQTILMGLLATILITGVATPSTAHAAWNDSPFSVLGWGARAFAYNLGLYPNRFFGHNSYERNDSGYGNGYSGWQQPQYLVPVPMPQTVYIAPDYYGSRHHHHHRYRD